MTHWKAQGMTLIRVRMRLGKAATIPGIGFVAVTRVGHLRRLVFDADLPEYEVFQAARHSESWRARRRFQLRQEARFSATLRKYGFCEADVWTREDAALAGRLLRELAAQGEMQRHSLRGQGRPTDNDAWLWPEGEPDFDGCLHRAALRVAGDDEELLGALIGVARRLRDDLHMPAVRQALGCLIPEALHPSLDGRRPRSGRAGGEERTGVRLAAGAWQVDVVAEQKLGRGGPQSVGLIEFFLRIARRVCEVLQLPVAIGSVALGDRVGRAKDVAALCRSVERWSSWNASEVRAARSFLVPAAADPERSPHDWVLLELEQMRPGEMLGAGGSLAASVADSRKRDHVMRRTAMLVDALVRGPEARAEPGLALVRQAACPECADMGVECLDFGFGFRSLVKAAGLEAMPSRESFVD